MDKKAMKLILPDPELFWEQEGILTSQAWWSLRIKEAFGGNYCVATINNSPENNKEYYWQSYSFAGSYLDTGTCLSLEEAKEAAIRSLIQENIITVE